MKGRKATPTNLKLLMGNPGKKKLNKDEPEPNPGIPPMPTWLSEFPIAVEEWNRESVILDGMRVMTHADSATLALRCYLASQIQELATDLKTEGRVTVIQKMDPLGNEILEKHANPKAIQIKNLITEYRQIGSLLGFDPASRTRLSVDPSQKKKSKFAGLVNAAGK